MSVCTPCDIRSSVTTVVRIVCCASSVGANRCIPGRSGQGIEIVVTEIGQEGRPVCALPVRHIVNIVDGFEHVPIARQDPDLATQLDFQDGCALGQA